MKNLPDGRTIDTDNFAIFNANWGVGAAPAAITQRYAPRTNSNPTSVVGAAQYPIEFAGSFRFVVTWRIPGTPLPTNTVLCAIYVNTGISGVSDTLPAAVATSGQFEGTIVTAIGDGISVGLLQSGTEAQASWLACFSVRAYLL